MSLANIFLAGPVQRWGDWGDRPGGSGSHAWGGEGDHEGAQNPHQCHHQVTERELRNFKRSLKKVEPREVEGFGFGKMHGN